MKDFQKISSNSNFHNDWVDFENAFIEIELVGWYQENRLLTYISY
jgi:hypothetical protein